MHRLPAAFAAALLILTIAACADDAITTTTTQPTSTTAPASDRAIATFETDDGGTYRVALEGEALRHAREAFAAGDPVGIPNGRIQPGDGGVNTGHDWHIDEIEFADMTTEVCDGTVSYVDDLGYEEFVDQHGERFCPWGAELIDLS